MGADSQGLVVSLHGRRTLENTYHGWKRHDEKDEAHHLLPFSGVESNRGPRWGPRLQDSPRGAWRADMINFALLTFFFVYLKRVWSCDYYGVWVPGGGL